MKIPDPYIKELVQGIAGDNGVKLVFLIKDRENVSEFKIAEKLGITVNEVRNILYRLQDHTLVYFSRKKDKKKGWYIYYWTFDMPTAHDVLIAMKKEKQQELRDILRQEKQGNVYVCPNKCVRITAEQALEVSFKCPECDAVLIEENVEKRTEKLKKDLEKVQKELEELLKIEKPLPKVEPEKKPKKKQPLKKPAKKATKKIKKKPTHKAKKHPHPIRHKEKPQPKTGFLSALRSRLHKRH